MPAQAIALGGYVVSTAIRFGSFLIRFAIPVNDRS
jgi:hypothetical protein